MRDLRYGIQHIWNTDEDLQRQCLESLVTRIRGVMDADIVARDIESLVKLGAFFVPDDLYMILHFGESIMDYQYGLYRGYRCTIAGRLAIPMEFLDGNVYGFIGYSNEDDSEPGDIDLGKVSEELSRLGEIVDMELEEDSEYKSTFIKYLYPPQFVMEKARYMFIGREEYRKAIEDGYICITDGLFDKHRLSTLGYNAVSLCGSSLTSWHKYYLSFIPHKIVIADNDRAGVKLARVCKSQLEGCIQLSFPKTKDIDDFLKTKEGIREFQGAFDYLKSVDFAFSYALTDFRSKFECTPEISKAEEPKVEEPTRFVYGNELSAESEIPQTIKQLLGRFDWFAEPQEDSVEAVSTEPMFSSSLAAPLMTSVPVSSGLSGGPSRDITSDRMHGRSAFAQLCFRNKT